ncbi:uncharacterized protein FOMMEDRAFT_138352 [Fomitiporia mediterranea MF3/22]|uniref:uncharacterized protein n=1 Tax=Fomitiporia mediterranea (strain MF3/22) TaxID=694068 RepID=UPI0004408F75|nr:uncharacterized protein FOMMEDRAFT_138352 [Fomitiporia mediterranea MF3/22]EJD06317.1 hypothetical protein FOMMEDRAFT_138352 [Fomitiporia mediterranea MF3/22]
MRESNFAFPAQNRACVCISSQLYDRRALDTNSPLPLLNSLTHLTYLTSTSPRIREILTCDGGLERLVRLLRDFCLSPPPPENPSAIFGLSPPGLPRPAQVPALNPKSFDRHASYRFSLAFQCVVNIGVRGSEPIRSRVVQAGTLEVVGCILEAWLASKGFAVGPSASASGIPRETREQRQQRRQQQLEQRQREQAQELARLLAIERSLANTEEEQNVATSDAETSVSTDTSANATPSGSGTPTSTVIVPGRDRSGTVVARRVWDTAQSNAREPTPAGPSMSRSRTVRAREAAESATPSASTSRPDTETEDDGDPDADGDVDMESTSHDHDTDENMPPRLPTHPHTRRTVGIVQDSPSPAATGVVGAGVAGASDALDVDMDAHIIINTNVGDDGVAEGIVALDQNVNDDLAMGAPPGAPGAIDATPRTRTNTLTLNTRNINLQREHHPHVHGREELTPRAVLANLPMHAHAHTHPHAHVPAPIAMPVAATGAGPSRGAAITQAALRAAQLTGANTANAATPAPTTMPPRSSHRHHHHHHHHAEEQGPYREEDVLLSLQLLAYLSKYPHVRQAFYKPRLSFHPATAMAQGHSMQNSSMTSTSEASGWRKTGTGASATANPAIVSTADTKKDLGFFRTLTGRGKEKEKTSTPATSGSRDNVSQTGQNSGTPPRMTNVFSLVERFTFRPSPTESALPSPPPFLPPEIQYWAGVIMRNACRKDESRGGIRQCANMLCGKWESFPREFAKCRRCRKAKYCGKECQSRAWSEGHRFWCSAREGEDGNEGTGGNGTSSGAGGGTTGATATTNPSQQNQSTEEHADVENNTTGTGASRATLDRIERRQARDRERQRMSTAAAAALAAMQPAPSAASAVAAARNASTSSTETAGRGARPSGPASLPAGSYMGTAGLSDASTATMLIDFASAALVQESLRRQGTALPDVANNSLATADGSVGELTLPTGINFNAYTAEQQATIRSFLHAVGIGEMQTDALMGPASQGAALAASGTGDVSVNIDFHHHGSEVERERMLPERIQAMNVGDRVNPPASSTSRSQGEGSQADMELTGDEMILG